jgi:hypothetical protein
MGKVITTLVGAALIVVAGNALARNDKVLLPIEAGWKGGGTVPVQFGSATKVAPDRVIEEIEAQGTARPGGGTGNSSNGFKSEPRSETEICQDALRKAIGELQSRARALGAVEVVGIVGSYREKGFDSPTQYECRMGHTRGVVDLRGDAVRAAPAAARN